MKILSAMIASFVLLSACTIASTEEESSSQESAIKTTSKKKGGGCGPVRWDGVASDVDKGVAAAAAEAEARRVCTETPSFCGLDCKGAPVVASSCVHYVVNDDPKIDEYYECTVTIEASGS